MVKTEDVKLPDDQLAKLWSALVKHKRHPELDQEEMIVMPVWVDENYAHSSSSSSDTDGGFGGCW